MMVIGKRLGVLMRSSVINRAALTRTGVRSGQDTVAIGLGVGHGQSTYPDPVKATQPLHEGSVQHRVELVEQLQRAPPQLKLGWKTALRTVWP